MKKIIFAAAFLATVLLASCARENTMVSEYTCLTVQSEEITRTLLGDADAGGLRKVYWQNGDKIAINGETSSALAGVAEKSTSATFAFASALSYPYCIVSPASAYTGENTVALPAVQKYTANSYDPQAALFLGYAAQSGSSPILKAACCVVKFSLTASSAVTLSSISVEGGNGEQMIGDFSANYTNGTLTSTSTADSLKTLSMDASGLVLGAEANDIFVVIPAQTYSKGLRITVKDADSGKMEKIKLSSAGFEAGKVYSFPMLEYKAEAEYVLSFDAWSNQNVKIKNTNFAFSPDGSTAYVMTYNKARILGAFDIKSGALKWQYNLNYAATNGGHFAVNPVTGDVIINTDKKLFSIKEDGSARWSVDIAKITAGCGPAFSPDAKTIYVGLEDKKIYAFNAEDGTVLGSSDVLAAKLAAIVVDSTTLFITTQSTTGYFFDVKEPSAFKQLGTITYTGNGSDISSPCVAPDKKTLYFTSKGNLHCVDLSTKTLLKSVSVGTDIVCGSVVTPSGDVATVYKDAAGGTMVLYSSGLETKKWEIVPVAYNNNFNYNCPAVDVNGNFYIVDGKANAWFIRATDGTAIKLYCGPQGIQNCTGMCGDILFSAGNASPAKVLGKKVPTSRGKGWSGNGGDICCTKCIQWVYPE